MSQEPTLLYSPALQPSETKPGSTVKPAPSKRSFYVQFLRNHCALASSIASILIFLLGLALIKVRPIGPNSRFVSEVVREYQFTPDFDQLAAHAITLLAIAIFSLGAFVLAKRDFIGVSDRRFTWKPGALTSVIFFTLGLIIYSFYEPHWLIVDSAALFCAIMAFLIALPFIPPRAIDLATLALIGAYLAILVVPGFLVGEIPLMSADSSALAQFETHLLYLTMPGHEIASGLNFFSQVPMGYGLLAPSIMSVLDRLHHNMTLGNQLHFVQACQLLFSVAAVCAYFSFRPRHLQGILLAMLLAGPYWATAGLGIWHPNQTGLRSIGLPLGILAIALVRRADTKRAGFWLGGAAAIILLSNFETSVAVLAGFAIYLVLRTRNIPIKAFLHGALGFICAIFAYCILYRIALGRLPISLHLHDVVLFMRNLFGPSQITDGLRLFDPGTENENLYIVPFALIMFGHGAYIVVSSFRTLGYRPLSHREAMRAAIAMILLVWLSYYFRAPNWWQIWTHLFLYGFLIVDTIDQRLFGLGLPERSADMFTRLRNMRMAPTHLVLLFFLGMMIVHTNQNLLQYTVDFMYPPWVTAPHNAAPVSDILLPADMAAALTAKANKLTALNRSTSGRAVYLTFNVSFMPELTGLFELGPERDLWVQIPGDAAFPATIAKILDRRPEVVLIDDPTGPLAVTGERKAFQDRVRRAVAREYKMTTTEDGWQIWRPK